MKSVGIVRKLDTLGRIVLPIELRNKLSLGEGDPVEIFTNNDTIVLKKYQPSCIFCGEAENVVHFKEKIICQDCLKELKKKK